MDKKNNLSAKEYFLVPVLILLFGLSCHVAGRNNAGLSTPGSGTNNTAGQKSKPLQFGILPYLSARLLFEKWQPMVIALEKKLGRKIVARTAPNFQSYIERVEKGTYDFYFTAPHFAAWSEKYRHDQRLVKFSRPLRGEIFVTRQSMIKGFGDLVGKRFATPDKLAIITIIGETVLEKNGLKLNKDVRIIHTSSHNSALILLASRHVDAAIAVEGLKKRMPRIVQGELRLLHTTFGYPHTMFMARNDLSAVLVEKLKQALLSLNGTVAGKAFFAKIGFGSLTPILDNDMQRLQAILPRLNERL